MVASWLLHYYQTGALHKMKCVARTPARKAALSHSRQPFPSRFPPHNFLSGDGAQGCYQTRGSVRRRPVDKPHESHIHSHTHTHTHTHTFPPTLHTNSYLWAWPRGATRFRGSCTGQQQLSNMNEGCSERSQNFMDCRNAGQHAWAGAGHLQGVGGVCVCVCVCVVLVGWGAHVCVGVLGIV